MDLGIVLQHHTFFCMPYTCCIGQRSEQKCMACSSLVPKYGQDISSGAISDLRLGCNKGEIAHVPNYYVRCA
jgi:hypothetical protein